MTTVQFSARQGLALRGKSKDSGNFNQLMKLRSNDVKFLETWLSRKVDMTSWATQNEVLDLLSHSVIRQICDSVRLSTQLAVSVDGTQDLSGLNRSLFA